MRIGKFDKTKKENERKARPILTVFGSVEDKRFFFRNIKELQNHEKYKEISISNDLTKQEREKESELREEADRKNNQESGRIHLPCKRSPLGQEGKTS